MTQREQNEPFFIYEHEGGCSVPATPLVSLPSGETEERAFIPVNFQRPVADSRFAETVVENNNPQCSAMLEDVRELGKDCGIIIHNGLIADENGEDTECDEDGEETVDENAFTYNIIGNRHIADGINFLTLSKN